MGLLSLIRRGRSAGGKGLLADLLAGLSYDEQRALLALCESLNESAAPAERTEREQAATSIIDGLSESRRDYIKTVIERLVVLDSGGYFSVRPRQA